LIAIDINYECYFLKISNIAPIICKYAAIGCEVGIVILSFKMCS